MDGKFEIEYYNLIVSDGNPPVNVKFEVEYRFPNNETFQVDPFLSQGVSVLLRKEGMDWIAEAQGLNLSGSCMQLTIFHQKVYS